MAMIYFLIVLKLKKKKDFKLLGFTNSDRNLFLWNQLGKPKMLGSIIVSVFISIVLIFFCSAFSV